MTDDSPCINQCGFSFCFKQKYFQRDVFFEIMQATFCSPPIPIFNLVEFDCFSSYPVGAIFFREYLSPWCGATFIPLPPLHRVVASITQAP